MALNFKNMPTVSRLKRGLICFTDNLMYLSSMLNLEFVDAIKPIEAQLLLGFLGFLGVVLTLAVNGYLQRRAIQLGIRQRAKALRIALLGELNVIKHSNDGRLGTLSAAVQDQSAQILIPTTELVILFPKMIDQIGLLSLKEVTSLVDAYLFMKEVPNRVKLLEQQIPDSRSEGWLRVTREHFGTVRTLYTSMSQKLEVAIHVLESEHKN